MKILLLAASSDEIIKEYFSKSEILISGVGMVNTTYTVTKHLSVNSYDLVINPYLYRIYNLVYPKRQTFLKWLKSK